MKRTEYFEIVKESVLAVFLLAKAIEKTERNYLKIFHVLFYWQKFKANLKKTRSVEWYWNRMSDQEKFFIYLWASSENNSDIAVAKKTVNTAIAVWTTGKNLYRYIKYR